MNNNNLIAGVDEAGRGPLAGPVFAAAVILDIANPIDGLKDSKKLTEKQRDRLFDSICDKSLSWSIAQAEVHEIDEFNILQASLLAMKRAVETLKISPHLVLVDGNQLPNLLCESKAIINGDALEECISAASILAKVARDREMIELDKQFPGYGLAIHKGYPTKMHREKLIELGVSVIHRKSFAPVKMLLK